VQVFFYFFSKNSHQEDKEVYDPIKMNREVLYSVLENKDLQKTTQGQLRVKSYRFFMCTFLGEGCTDNPEDGNKNYGESIMGGVSKLITIPVSNPPASGVIWVQNTFEKAGFVPESYAATGIGFRSIQAFMPLWKVFRDVSYLLMVLVIVVIGFLIMFRTKLDGQTAVAIESALPRIVVTLILITFSFPIVGFLIDITYLLIYMSISLFSATGLKVFSDINELQSQMMNNVTAGVFNSDTFFGYAAALRGLLDFILNPVLQGIFSALVGLVVLFFSLKFASGISDTVSKFLGNFELAGALNLVVVEGQVSFKIGNLISILISLAIGFLLGTVLVYWILPLVIVLTGLLFLIGRILFLILGAYVRIVLYIIFAPIIILPNAIPGQNSFMGWLRFIAGNLLIFPLIVVFFLVVLAIQDVSNVGGWGEFLVPFVTKSGVADPNSPSFMIPLAWSFDTRILPIIISAVMLMMIPELIQKIVQPIVGESFLPEGNVGILFGGLAGAATTVTAASSYLMSSSEYLDPASFRGRLAKGIARATGVPEARIGAHFKNPKAVYESKTSGGDDNNNKEATKAISEAFQRDKGGG
jgi:hypothetical protein